VETGEVFYANGEERSVDYTVTRVMTHNMEGEKEITIPSKVIREMLNIVEMDGHRFNDRAGICIAFRREINEEQHDQQELVFVDSRAVVVPRGDLKIKATKRPPKSHLKRAETSQKIGNKLRGNALWAGLSAESMKKGAESTAPFDNQ
jgi:hypothetical protein